MDISKTEKYKEHINNHNVIRIDFSDFDTKNDTYEDYINKITLNLQEEIIFNYPNIKLPKNTTYGMF